MRNITFIDGQNLYLGTSKCISCARKLGRNIFAIKFSDCVCGKAWKIDLHKFRVYLRDKYRVDRAYYFLGHLREGYDYLYRNIQEVGFIVVFKDHTRNLKSEKKGNVDTDIVFESMKSVLEDTFEKILLVSGDGDYSKLVDYLIKKGKFEKILFPNKDFASSLYNKFSRRYYGYLEDEHRKEKIRK
jgi:uncharacterized LabA/DUF88 family protein